MNRSSLHNMYFIAVVCPPELDKKLLGYKLWMKEKFGCVVALKSPAHVTLVPPFWLNEEKEKELLAVFRNFSSDMAEIVIELNGFSYFGKRVLFANVVVNPALEELQQQVESYFVESFPAQIRNDERPFHPHITIATRDMKPSAFEKALEVFSNKELVESFSVKNIYILKLSSGRWEVIAGRYWSEM